VNKPFKRCWCREPATIGPDGKRRPGRLLGSACPDLGKKGHGHWYGRIEAPVGPDGKRRQPWVGPCDTEREAKDALLDALGAEKDGKHAADRKMTTGGFLVGWLEDQRPTLKPRTWESYAEAVRLYYKPGIGHIRLADLRDHHIRALYAAMRKINRPEADAGGGELLRRLLAARVTVPHLPGRLRVTKPLGEAAIRRRHAVLSAALNDAVERHLIAVNPAATVKIRPGKARPLLWTEPRVAQWRKDGKRPARVMVWSASQTGQFLDAIMNDRLYPLYHLAAYWGLRRQELVSLRWADLDLASRRLHVRGEVKSEDSDRIIIIDQGTAKVLAAWQERQLFEALEWDAAWQDSGRVFTREDGSPLRPGAVYDHFTVLVRQAHMPPVAFHGLRHGAATMLIAAGQSVKVVSAVLGHATAAFTMDVYAVVAEELAESAAAAIEAFVPRKGRTGAAQ
jgi:integrase